MVYMISYTGTEFNSSQTFDLRLAVETYPEWAVLNDCTYLIYTTDTQECVLEQFKNKLHPPFRLFISKIEPPMCWYNFNGANLKEWCERVFSKEEKKDETKQD